MNDVFTMAASLLSGLPHAVAMIEGSREYPEIEGEVRFYQTEKAVLVAAKIQKLPNTNDACDSPVFGFHIHEGGSCTGNTEDAFAGTGTHYNPYQCKHPYHAGDMPPLFGCEGEAYLSFLTDRFTVEEIVGRTVVIHAKPDDFMTQPAGNAGMKIACGVIMQVRR